MKNYKYGEKKDVPKANDKGKVQGKSPDQSFIRRVASGRYDGIPLPK